MSGVTSSRSAYRPYASPLSVRRAYPARDAGTPRVRYAQYETRSCILVGSVAMLLSVNRSSPSSRRSAYWSSWTFSDGLSVIGWKLFSPLTRSPTGS
jgi:hypothetical protein